MAFTLAKTRLDGCLFGPPSPRDYKTVFNEGPVPDAVDLRDFCTPIEDQGQIGSCTANAAVGALEYGYKRRDGRSPDFSRMFVYFNARRMRGQVMLDSGAQIREAMASVMAFGVCREDIWPYNPMLFAQEPPPEAYAEAWKYEPLQYARVDGGRGAIQALATGLPVVFGTTIPERCYVEAERTGILPPATADEIANAQGGHSMLLVGYDQNKRMFLVRNSWGPNWGDNGYCWIPYDLIDACSHPEEFWVIAELEKRQAEGFQLIRPGGGKAAKDEWDDYERRKGERGTVGGLADTASRLREQLRAGLEADITSSTKKIDELIRGKKS